MLKTFSNLLLISTLLVGCGPQITKELEPLPAQVAHTLGSYRGQAYLNCLECFEENYARGFRYFEVDLWKTTDGVVVAYHPGFEKLFGLTSVRFTHAEFMAKRPKGTTPLDIQGLAALLAAHPDAYLIADAKYDVAEANTDVCAVLGEAVCLERVLPFLYRGSDYVRVGASRYQRVVLQFAHDYPERHEKLSKLMTEPNVVAAQMNRYTLEAKPWLRNMAWSTDTQLVLSGYGTLDAVFRAGGVAAMTNDWMEE